MFSKKKCLKCGAKNPEGLTTCAICGSPFLLREMEKFLWNPNAIGRWSLLFYPLFGSILTFMNWRAFGKDKEAKKALVCILISTLVLVALLFLLAQQYFGFTALGIVAFIIVWYSSLNSPQTKYFKIELNNQYIKKKWGNLLYWHQEVWLVREMERFGLGNIKNIEAKERGLFFQ